MNTPTLHAPDLRAIGDCRYVTTSTGIMIGCRHFRKLTPTEACAVERPASHSSILVLVGLAVGLIIILGKTL